MFPMAQTELKSLEREKKKAHMKLVIKLKLK